MSQYGFLASPVAVARDIEATKVILDDRIYRLEELPRDVAAWLLEEDEDLFYEPETA